jgi:hypothetical protein
MFISAGTAALLVALFVLWQSTRSSGNDRPAPPPRVVDEPAPAPTPMAPTTPAAPPPSTRAARPPAIPAPAPSRTPTAPAAPAPVMPEPQPAPSPETANLHYGATQLNAQTKAVEPLVQDCVAKAGGRLSGTVSMTYMVAKADDGYQITETGIDYGKTTIDNEPLLECLHQTAKSMKFEGLPYNVNAIEAARRVTLEAGKITEYKHMTYRSR